MKLRRWCAMGWRCLVDISQSTVRCFLQRRSRLVVYLAGGAHTTKLFTYWTMRLQTRPRRVFLTPKWREPLSALADVQYGAGHYQVCVPLYQRLLDLHRKVYGPKHPLIADDLSGLAAAETDLGYYGDAESLAKQAMDVTRSYYGADNPKVAGNLTTLGRALTYQNKYDEATECVAAGPDDPGACLWTQPLRSSRNPQ